MWRYSRGLMRLHVAALAAVVRPGDEFADQALDVNFDSEATLDSMIASMAVGW